MVAVIRGFIIPYPEKTVQGYEYIDALDVTGESRSLCVKLKKHLMNALEYLNKYYEGLKELDLHDKIGDKASLVNDVLVWLLRAPLHLDPVPGAVISPYKLYLAFRLLPPDILDELFETKVNENDIVDFVEKLLELVLRAKRIGEQKTNTPATKIIEGLKGLLKLVDDKDFRVTVEKALYLLPSDTRPGFNTTNLITHLILTSGISWALQLYRGRLDWFSVLAALLHDIGKPCNPENHVEESKKYAEDLLSTLRSMLEVDEIKYIVELIETHHSRKDSPVAIADRISSKERNVKLVKEILLKENSLFMRKIRKKNLEEQLPRDDITKLFTGTGKGIWGFWKKFTASELIDISKYFVGEARKRMFMEAIDREYKVEELKIATIDVRGIQKAIRRADDLKIMIATSYLIDVLVIAYIPYKLWRDGNVPLSAIIYSAGGLVTLILPSNMNIGDIIEKLNNIARENIGVKIVYADSEFNTNYAIMMNKLMQKLGIVKIESEEPGVIAFGHEELCDYCKTERAVKRDTVTGRRVGRLCDRIRKFGDKIHFKVKLGLGEYGKGIVVDGKSFTDIYASINNIEDLIKEKLIEYYSGWDPDEKYEKSMNYAIISVDGNLMGLFMSSSISFSDAVERSFRIDLALKKALRDTIDHVKKALSLYGNDRGIREAIRIASGIFYVGGDDARLIVPSWLSIPVTLLVSSHFYRYMGGYATLSIGIASVPVKHSIWGAIEASSSMEEKAKHVGRAISLVKWLKKEYKGFGTVSLIYADSTSLLTRSKTEYLFEEVGGLGLSIQPYVLMGDVDFAKITSTLLGLGLYTEKIEDKAVEVAENLSKKLIHLGYEAIYGNTRSSRLMKTMRILREALDYYNGRFREGGSPDYAVISLLIFLKRQSSRLGHRGDYYENILSTTINDKVKRRIIIPLYDLYSIIKILGGGII